MRIRDDGRMSLPHPNGADAPIRFAPAMHVQPSPISVKATRLPDGNVVLHLEHATGATILPMTQEFAKSLIAQLQQATGGLVVPPSTPSPG